MVIYGKWIKRMVNLCHIGDGDSESDDESEEDTEEEKVGHHALYRKQERQLFLGIVLIYIDNSKENSDIDLASEV